MPAVMERPVTIDADLARRAQRKLRRHGWTFDDVLNRALSVIVTVRGTPDFMGEDEADETPNAALLESFEEGRRIMSGEQPVKWKTPQELFAEWDGLYARNH